MWCEVAPLKVGADGAKSLPEGISLVSEFQKVNEGKVSFVFFGSYRDVLDVLPMAQKQYDLVYPY